MNSSENEELAAIAAQALCAGVVSDFDTARNYAMRQQRGERRASGPDNLQIHAALVEQLSLFDFDVQHQRITQLRVIALDCLARFEEFQPRLVGPVLYGTALDVDPITLHVFSEEVEQISRFLIQQRYKYSLGEITMRFSGKPMQRDVPVFSLVVADTDVDLVVLASTHAADRPLSSLSGSPMLRFTAAEVKNLLDIDQLFVAVERKKTRH